MVEAVGAAVKDFQPGDRVFGYPGGRFGSYAEYVTIGEDQAIAHAPGISPWRRPPLSPSAAQRRSTSCATKAASRLGKRFW
jgi:hypothetical protein